MAIGQDSLLVGAADKDSLSGGLVGGDSKESIEWHDVAGTWSACQLDFHWLEFAADHDQQIYFQAIV